VGAGTAGNAKRPCGRSASPITAGQPKAPEPGVKVRGGVNPSQQVDGAGGPLEPRKALAVIIRNPHNPKELAAADDQLERRPADLRTIITTVG
jgi:hypothetical protein